MCTKESTTSAREMACVVLLLSLLFLRKIFFLRFFADSTIKFDCVLTPSLIDERTIRKRDGDFVGVDESFAQKRWCFSFVWTK